MGIQKTQKGKHEGLMHDALSHLACTLMCPRRTCYRTVVYLEIYIAHKNVFFKQEKGQQTDSIGYLTFQSLLEHSKKFTGSYTVILDNCGLLELLATH